jgi:MinD superfamily P-loop ATPase
MNSSLVVKRFGASDCTLVLQVLIHLEIEPSVVRYINRYILQ